MSISNQDIREHQWVGICGEAAAVLYECELCGVKKTMVLGKLSGKEPGLCQPQNKAIEDNSNLVFEDDDMPSPEYSYNPKDYRA